MQGLPQVRHTPQRRLHAHVLHGREDRLLGIQNTWLQMKIALVGENLEVATVPGVGRPHSPPRRLPVGRWRWTIPALALAGGSGELKRTNCSQVHSFPSLHWLVFDLFLVSPSKDLL